MTVSELLEIVYRFYPRGLWVDSPGYGDTPELRRRRDVARRAADEYPKWKALLDRLRPRYGIYDCSLHVLAGWVDSAYTLKLSIPGKEAEDDELERRFGFQVRFGCRVSFLGPYYLVCRLGTSDEEPYVHDVAQEIERAYPAYEPIPPELGNVVVPDVALDTVGLGEATIYHCLLGTHWPGDLRPAKPATTGEATGVIIYDGDTCHMLPRP
jgi:hypothetical protein